MTEAHVRETCGSKLYLLARQSFLVQSENDLFSAPSGLTIPYHFPVWGTCGFAFGYNAQSILETVKEL